MLRIKIQTAFYNMKRPYELLKLEIWIGIGVSHSANDSFGNKKKERPERKKDRDLSERENFIAYMAKIMSDFTKIIARQQIYCRIPPACGTKFFYRLASLLHDKFRFHSRFRCFYLNWFSQPRDAGSGSESTFAQYTLAMVFSVLLHSIALYSLDAACTAADLTIQWKSVASGHLAPN